MNSSITHSFSIEMADSSSFDTIEQRPCASLAAMKSSYKTCHRALVSASPISPCVSQSSLSSRSPLSSPTAFTAPANNGDSVSKRQSVAFIDPNLNGGRMLNWSGGGDLGEPLNVRPPLRPFETTDLRLVSHRSLFPDSAALVFSPMLASGTMSDH